MSKFSLEIHSVAEKTGQCEFEIGQIELYTMSICYFIPYLLYIIIPSPCFCTSRVCRKSGSLQREKTYFYSVIPSTRIHKNTVKLQLF